MEKLSRGRREHERKLSGRRLIVSGNKFLDAFGEMGSLAGPILDTISPQLHSGWVGAGIVGAHDFERPPVAGTVFLNDNYAVVRLLARAETR
jgi:hypothetical protein